MTQTQPPLAKPPGFRETGLPIHKPPPSRKANLPSSFYAQKKQRSFCCRCFRCIFIFVILIALFFISFGGFLYLWYAPRSPIFALKSCRVNKFNVTKTPDSEGSAVDSQISVSMEFKNANENIKLMYDGIAISLYNDDIAEGLSLGKENVPGFTQERNTATVVKFSLKGNQVLGDFKAQKPKINSGPGA